MSPHVPSLPTIGIESFRAFRDHSEFELRPLTLLYGRNQAGKSTLLRLLPLLGDSLTPGVGVYDKHSSALRGATFKELGWLGPGPVLTPRIDLGMRRSDGVLVRCFLQWADSGRGPPVLNAVRLEENERQVLNVSLSGELPPRSDRWSGTFTGTLDGKDWTGPIECEGLLPCSLPEPAKALTDELAGGLAILQRVQWLHAWRADGASRLPTRTARMHAPDGSDLAQVLQGERSVVGAASDWLSRPTVLSEAISLVPDSTGRHMFHLQSDGAERLPLQLAGEGARALLPIIAHACFAESDNPRRPSMLAIEEPEAHLHPSLQVELLDRLIDTVNKGVPVVLETHSVQLLRAMQRAVLKRRLAPGQVGVYWVDRVRGGARLRRIEVTVEATLSGWPPSVLEEEQVLAREVAELRWERGAE